MSMSRQIDHAVIDMDGIIADFHRGVAEANGVPYAWRPGEHWCVSSGLGIPTPWYAKCDVEFWAYLPKTPFADLIINLVLARFASDNICIGTAFANDMPPDFAGRSCEGKIHWLRKHYPQLAKAFQFGNAKHFLANSQTVLIDDSDTNITAFKKKGGHGLLVPRPWNSQSQTEDVDAYLADVFLGDKLYDLSHDRRTLQDSNS